MSRYAATRRTLERAERTIPLGAQTFSKSKLYWGEDAPLFADRASGSRIWDVDGNEYIDFVSGLCAVNLGYGDPDVERAVDLQRDMGIVSASLSTRLEHEVAELICEMVPCAEMVRFGKNGSDATTGAIRVARAFTKRDHIARCGYHGWQDWCIGNRNRNGVPEAVDALTHTFAYNDSTALAMVLAEYECAAIIMESMAAEWPRDGYLEFVRNVAHHFGALLIFDETITGFRFANGGAQELFGVTPDLACFGKGLANGFPLSAIAGRRDIMKLFAGDIFYSFTAGGEALSLAAAKATLLKLKREPVCQRLAELGQLLKAGIPELTGHPSRQVLELTDEKRHRYAAEMCRRGILTGGHFNISYAHTEADIGAAVAAHREAVNQ